ncbi:hypothetical protein L1987_06847 [Smallanthus sonchifolius]|uniref:Uncharacterized protein n=1 Tax=Smallanthus sonchifolius TaxID=185202 RepID=A0ACB9JZM5_9ASTR|nr:hypothetical protein L1987_06847 [Smallanthus sonchifolius]
MSKTHYLNRHTKGNIKHNSVEVYLCAELHGLLKTYELEMSQDSKLLNTKKKGAEGVPVLEDSLCHPPKSQHLADTSKGKKHIIDAPSNKVVSLGSRDSPNPIGKKLPTKPSNSLKRKISDTPVSSPQDEAIPTSPITSSWSDLQTTPKEPISLGKGSSKDSKKFDKDNFDLKESTTRYHSLAIDVSTLQTSVSTLQTNQLVAIHLATANNRMLKQILTTLPALSKPLTPSNPMDANRCYQKGGEQTCEVEALEKQVPKRVRVKSDQHSIGQHQAPLETEISKPLPTSAEPIFTSVATESSSVATEPHNREKAKGKMPIIEEEEEQMDLSEHITTDPHSIIPGTNMPLVLADETTQRFQEEENEAAKREEAERKLEVSQSKAVARRAIQKKISQKENILKVRKEIGEESKNTSPQQTSPRIEISSPQPEKKSLAKKPRKARIISWTHIGRRYVIKRDDNKRETFKCISDVMELPDLDLQKIKSLEVDRFNESESSRMFIEALKQRGFTGYEQKEVEEEPLEVIPIISWELMSKTEQFIITYQNGVQEYLSADRIVTLVPNDLRALLKIHLKNESNDR